MLLFQLSTTRSERLQPSRESCTLSSCILKGRFKIWEISDCIRARAFLLFSSLVRLNSFTWMELLQLQSLSLFRLSSSSQLARSSRCVFIPSDRKTFSGDEAILRRSTFLALNCSSGQQWSLKFAATSLSKLTRCVFPPCSSEKKTEEVLWSHSGLFLT